MSAHLPLLQTVLRAHQRVAITGPSRTGKSALSQYVMDRPLIHCDDFMHLPWSEASEAITERVNAIDGCVIVEGVAVPRALRKGMKVDAVIWLQRPFFAHTSGQASQAKGHDKVMREVMLLHPTLPVYVSG